MPSAPPLPPPASPDAPPSDPAGSLLSLPPPQLPGDELIRLARLHWGVEGQLVPLTSERDQNHRLDGPAGSFVLKLSNPAEPAAMTEFQTAALIHAAAADPGLPVPPVYPARDGRVVVATPAGALRLLGWCPGTPLARLPRSEPLARATGDAAARLTRALSDFRHPADDHVLLWDLRQFPRLQPLAPALPPALAAELAEAQQRFAAQIAPVLGALPTQVVHADFNPHNLLADPEAPTRLTAVLDFGDMVRTPRICDLAVAASYLVEPDAPLRLVAPLVAAYHARLPLQPQEIRLLPLLIECRMLTTLTIATWRAGRYPGNADYILRNAPSARAGLQALRAADPGALVAPLLAACERPAP